MRNTDGIWTRAGLLLAVSVGCGRSQLYAIGHAGAPGTADGGQGGGAGQGGTLAAGRGGSGPAGSGGVGGTAGSGPAGSGGTSAGRAGFGGGGGVAATGGSAGFAASAGFAGEMPKPRCGNGRLELGEECDDGNGDSTDDCVADCHLASCRDGFVWRGHESCDDGNAAAGDGCSPDCREEVWELAVGMASVCATGALGHVKCWGQGTTGVLGLGDNQNRGDQPGEMGRALPAVDLGRDRQITRLVAGAQHACEADQLGVLKCWGYNGDGELGLGDTQSRGDQPGEMGDNLPAVPLQPYLSLAAGFDATCAADVYQSLHCWGNNLAGQLGLGDTAARGDQPYEVAYSAVNLGFAEIPVAVAVGTDHACAELKGGSLKCWGGNARGQLGLGDTLTRGNAPNQMGDNLARVDLGGLSIRKLAAGDYRTCVLFSGDVLKCWGANYQGQLGLGDFDDRGVMPDQLGSNLPALELGGEVADFAMGKLHTCALLTDGRVKCWGVNAQGQLGLPGVFDRGGNPDDMGDNLPAVDLGMVEPIAIYAGGDETCVLLDDHRVKCWGANYAGQLGLGDTANRGSASGTMGDNLPFVDVGF